MEMKGKIIFNEDTINNGKLLIKNGKSETWYTIVDMKFVSLFNKIKGYRKKNLHKIYEKCLKEYGEGNHKISINPSLQLIASGGFASIFDFIDHNCIYRLIITEGDKKIDTFSEEKLPLLMDEKIPSDLKNFISPPNYICYNNKVMLEQLKKYIFNYCYLIDFIYNDLLNKGSDFDDKTIYVDEIEKKMDFIYKSSKNVKVLRLLEHVILGGDLSLTDKFSKCNFIRMIDFFTNKVNPSLSYFHLDKALGNCVSVNFKESDTDEPKSIVESDIYLKLLFLQLSLFYLGTRKHFLFSHGDLKLDNILVYKTGKFSVNVDDNFFYFDNPFKFSINDFDLSYINSDHFKNSIYKKRVDFESAWFYDLSYLTRSIFNIYFKKSPQTPFIKFIKNFFIKGVKFNKNNKPISIDIEHTEKTNIKNLSLFVKKNYFQIWKK